MKKRLGHRHFLVKIVQKVEKTKVPSKGLKISSEGSLKNSL